MYTRVFRHIWWGPLMGGGDNVTLHFVSIALMIGWQLSGVGRWGGAGQIEARLGWLLLRLLLWHVDGLRVVDGLRRCWLGKVRTRSLRGDDGGAGDRGNARVSTR